MKKYAELEAIKSIYLFGDPGSGKSMFMDKFFRSLAIPEERKKFMHYKEFMLEIHEEEHRVN